MEWKGGTAEWKGGEEWEASEAKAEAELSTTRRGWGRRLGLWDGAGGRELGGEGLWGRDCRLCHADSS